LLLKAILSEYSGSSATRRLSTFLTLTNRKDANGIGNVLQLPAIIGNLLDGIGIAHSTTPTQQMVYAANNNQVGEHSTRM
jgi:hypothetical protein